VSLVHAAGLSLDGDVQRSLCSFQRPLRRLSRVTRTTVSQNSTACGPPRNSEELRLVGGGPSPVDVPGRSGVSVDDRSTVAAG